MKRGARDHEVSCPELDPGLMEVRDHEGAEYPGQYWANGAKIKVSRVEELTASNVNFFCQENMLGACTTHILFAPDRRI